METYGRFLFEFLDQFFSGFKDIFGGFFSGFQKIFNIGKYKEIVQYYKNDFSVSEWVLVAIRLRDAFPTVTASDFVSGNYMRMNYLTDNQANVPQEVNVDWFVITDEVLTGVGAVDVTNLLN